MLRTLNLPFLSPLERPLSVQSNQVPNIRPISKKCKKFCRIKLILTKVVTNFSKPKAPRSYYLIGSKQFFMQKAGISKNTSVTQRTLIQPQSDNKNQNQNQNQNQNKGQLISKENPIYRENLTLKQENQDLHDRLKKFELGKGTRLTSNNIYDRINLNNRQQNIKIAELQKQLEAYEIECARIMSVLTSQREREQFFDTFDVRPDYQYLKEMIAIVQKEKSQFLEENIQLKYKIQILQNKIQEMKMSSEMKNTQINIKNSELRDIKKNQAIIKNERDKFLQTIKDQLEFIKNSQSYIKEQELKEEIMQHFMKIQAMAKELNTKEMLIKENIIQENQLRWTVEKLKNDNDLQQKNQEDKINSLYMQIEILINEKNQLNNQMKEMEVHYNNFQKKQYHENDPEQNVTKIWDMLKKEQKKQVFEKHMTINEHLKKKTKKEDVIFIIHTFKMIFMAQQLSYEDMMSHFPQKGECSVKDLVDMFEQPPYSCNSIETRVLLAKYLIKEENSQNQKVNSITKQRSEIIKSIFKMLFKDFKIYTKEAENVMYHQIKEQIGPKSSEILGIIQDNFYRRKKVQLTMEYLSELYQKAGLDLSSINQEFVLFKMFQKDGKMENLSFQTFFECFLSDKFNIQQVMDSLDRISQ